MNNSKFLAMILALMLFTGTAIFADVLVYDNNTNNSYAQTAAASFGEPVTVGVEADFNTLLTGQAWTLVFVDCPSTIPTGGWTDLITYVNGGGVVVMSFWDWDNDSGQGDAGLFGAFGFDTAVSIALADAVDVLTASATPAGAAIFAGNPGMPHSSWLNSWGDDGDAFTFTGGEAVADLNGGPNPVSIVNDAGNAIATFGVDEWNGAGAVEYWEGMGNYVLGGGPVSVIEVPILSPRSTLLLIMLLSMVGVVLVRRF